MTNKIKISRVKYSELADYLKVTESAVKQYSPIKRELMLIGLKVKKNYKVREEILNKVSIMLNEWYLSSESKLKDILETMISRIEEVEELTLYNSEDAPKFFLIVTTKENDKFALEIMPSRKK